LLAAGTAYPHDVFVAAFFMPGCLVRIVATDVATDVAVAGSSVCPVITGNAAELLAAPGARVENRQVNRFFEIELASLTLSAIPFRVQPQTETGTTSIDPKG